MNNILKEPGIPLRAMARALRFKYMAIGALMALSAMTVACTQGSEQPVHADPAHNDRALVKTADGLIGGKLLPDGVEEYLGIRYAKPPVGKLRWKAPQPVAPWKGVYHADRKMPECIQVLRPHDINHYFGEEATSEDCLFMNIWTPANAKPGDKLPVVVFIHGGGLTVGSGNMALYGGKNVARDGAVFVNFNYRLGLLGFMASKELTAESPHHSSGNYGILDQIAALKWVHRNIAAFGGDPGKVIIVGQSGGARSTSMLQVTPLAKGLFHGIVAMSHALWSQGPKPELPTLAVAEKLGPEVAKALGVHGLKALRQVPADQILALQEAFQVGHARRGIKIRGPNLDGYLFPAQPAALFAQNRGGRVPVILGFTRDEDSARANALTKVQTVSQLDAVAKQLYGPRAAEFYKLYPASNDAEARAMAIEASRNAGSAEQGAWWWAVEQNKFGLPAYVYEFAHVQPFNPAVTIADHPERLGAFHTSDVPYWFQTLDSLNMFRQTRLWKPADRQLAKMMTSMLISFAKTGNPTSDAPGAPSWPAFSPSSPSLLKIGDSASVSFHVRQMPVARMKFQAAHPPELALRNRIQKDQASKPVTDDAEPLRPFSRSRD